MRHNQFILLKDFRFLPLFVVQFLGAFHDNLFKNALVVLLLYGGLSQAGQDPKFLVTLAAGLFILPFILFSALGGQIADKYQKHRVVRAVKLAEIVIAGFGIASLYSGSVYFCFATLFALGAQSAFFGPSKYSLLPEHLEERELIGGNGLLNTGSFLAILFGTITGTILVAMKNGLALVSLSLVLCASIGYAASRFIPDAPSKTPDLKLDFNPLNEIADILKFTIHQRSGVVQAIFGVAWFYFMGSMYMAQFPNYTAETLQSNAHVLAFFLVIFSIGIAVGSLLNNLLLKGVVSAIYVPAAMAAISIFSVDLYFAGQEAHVISGQLLGLAGFLSVAAHWRIVMDAAAIAVCGGLFVVPLSTMIQNYTREDVRARVLAGSAIMNALFVMAASAMSAVLILKGWSIGELFVLFALINGLVAAYMYIALRKF